MSDSRARYLAWLADKNLRDTYDRWETWQAAEAQAVRRCAEIVESAHGSACNEAYDAICAEFPEAFK